MYKNYRIGAVLLMAGKGLRLGSPTPKQFLPLNGKQLYQYALETFVSSQLFDEIVLVCHPDWMHLPHAGLVPGGETRQESSFRGLKGFQKKPDIVLIHDGVRPFVSQQTLIENIEGAIAWGAADTCIPSADTIVHTQEGRFLRAIPPREEYWRGQTPQTFDYDLLLHAHEKAQQDGVVNASDDCRLVLRLEKKVYIVQGEEKNLKITTEFDLLVASAYLQSAVQVISSNASIGSLAT